MRREGELAVRAALGASTSALRRALLAESLLLCGAGALLGVLIARPMVSILANYASRFSVRALDLTVDSSMLWVGAGLALVAAVLLAFVPRLPSADSANGIAASTVRVGMSGSTSRRLRIFAITQIAASFLLLAGASVLVKTLLVLQYTQTGLDTDHVLVFDVPPMMYGKTPEEVAGFYREVQRRVAELPGVNQVAVGSTTPWRDAGSFGPGLEFSTDGRTHAAGEEDPRGLMRAVSPGYFSTLGVPIVAGRDFNASDTQTKDAEPVVIVSQSVAQLLFPNQDPINRHIRWTDPVVKFIPGVSGAPRRVVGVIADIDDEHVIPQPTLAIYSPFEQFMISGRLFVHTATTKPYGLVTPITRIIHGLSTDQPVEHPATLSDIRAEMLTSDRLQLDCVWRVRVGGTGDCRGGRGGRAGVFGQRADARIWYSPGNWLAAESLAGGSYRPGRGDGWSGDRNRSSVRLCVGEASQPLLFAGCADAQRAAGGGVGAHFAGCGGDCVSVASGARGASRCDASVANGLICSIQLPNRRGQ